MTTFFFGCIGFHFCEVLKRKRPKFNVFMGEKMSKFQKIPYIYHTIFLYMVQVSNKNYIFLIFFQVHVLLMGEFG